LAVHEFDRFKTGVKGVSDIYKDGRKKEVQRSQSWTQFKKKGAHLRPSEGRVRGKAPTTGGNSVEGVKGGEVGNQKESGCRTKGRYSRVCGKVEMDSHRKKTSTKTKKGRRNTRKEATALRSGAR